MHGTEPILVIAGAVGALVVITFLIAVSTTTETVSIEINVKLR